MSGRVEEWQKPEIKEQCRTELKEILTREDISIEERASLFLSLIDKIQEYDRPPTPPAWPSPKERRSPSPSSDKWDDPFVMSNPYLEPGDTDFGWYSSMGSRESYTGYSDFSSNPYSSYSSSSLFGSYNTKISDVLKEPLSPGGETPIQLAMKSSDKISDNIIKQFIDNGIHVLDTSLLESVIKFRGLEMVEFLCQRNRDLVSAWDSNGNNMLSLALSENKNDIARYFRKQGLNLTYEKKKPLHYATTENIDFIYELFPDANKYLESRDQNYKTALEVALEKKNYPLAKLLHDKGAVIQTHVEALVSLMSDKAHFKEVVNLLSSQDNRIGRLPDSLGVCLAMEMSKNPMDEELFELLSSKIKQFGRDPDNMVSYANIRFGKAESAILKKNSREKCFVETMIKLGIVEDSIPYNPVTMKDGSAGHNIVHAAAREVNYDKMNLLVSKMHYDMRGILSAQTYHGYTPLELYCHNKKKKGAEIDAADIELFKKYQSRGINLKPIAKYLSDEQTIELRMSAHSSAFAGAGSSSVAERKLDAAFFYGADVEHYDQSGFIKGRKALAGCDRMTIAERVSELDGKLRDGSMIFVCCHGGYDNNDEHYIVGKNKKPMTTDGLFREIALAADGKAVQVALLSCFGAKAAKYIRYLPKDSVLLCLSSKDTVTRGDPFISVQKYILSHPGCSLPEIITNNFASFVSYGASLAYTKKGEGDKPDKFEIFSFRVDPQEIVNSKVACNKVAEHLFSLFRRFPESVLPVCPSQKEIKAMLNKDTPLGTVFSDNFKLLEKRKITNYIDRECTYPKEEGIQDPEGAFKDLPAVVIKGLNDRTNFVQDLSKISRSVIRSISMSKTQKAARDILSHMLARGDIFDNISIMKEVISSGINPNSQDHSGSTALHHAIIQGNSSVVSFLVKSKADVDIKNKDDKSPVDLASESANLDMLIALLKGIGPQPKKIEEIIIHNRAKLVGKTSSDGKDLVTCLRENGLMSHKLAEDLSRRGRSPSPGRGI